MSREDSLELARGLREAADWIEANPDLPMTVQPYENISFNVSGKQSFQTCARALGTFDKNPENRAPLKEWYYTVSRMFGRLVCIDILVSRETVCRKVRVMKEVDAYECADSILEPLAEVVEV